MFKQNRSPSFDAATSVNGLAASTPCARSDNDRSQFLLQGAGTQHSVLLAYDGLSFEEDCTRSIQYVGAQFTEKESQPVLHGRSSVSWLFQRDTPPGQEPVVCRTLPHADDSEFTQSVPSLTTDRSSGDARSSIADDAVCKEYSCCFCTGCEFKRFGIANDTPCKNRDCEDIASEVIHYQSQSCDYAPSDHRNVGQVNQDNGMDTREEFRVDGDLETPDEIQSEDGDSFWMSDYSESTQDLIGKQPQLYAYRCSVLKQILHEFSEQIAMCVDGPGKANTNHCAGGDSVNDQTLDQDAGHEGSKKRKRVNGEENEGKDSTQGRTATSQKPKANNPRRLLLACPFSKKDPSRYRCCYRNKLSKISYVKQHLSRHHPLPIYCSICSDTFESEDIRDDHIRTRTCIEQPKKVWEGVSQAQKKELKKHVSPQMSEEEQWFTIYEVLFPGEQRPCSAYIDSELSEEICAFRDFATGNGPRIISECLRREGYFLDDQNDEQQINAFQETVIADGIQTIFQRWHESEDQRKLAGTGTTHVNGTLETEGESQDSGSSSKTLVGTSSNEARRTHCRPLNTVLSLELLKNNSNQPPLNFENGGGHSHSENRWPESPEATQHPLLETLDGIDKPLESTTAQHHSTPLVDDAAIETRSDLEGFFELAEYIEYDAIPDPAGGMPLMDSVES